MFHQVILYSSLALLASLVAANPLAYAEADAEAIADPTPDDGDPVSLVAGVGCRGPIVNVFEYDRDRCVNQRGGPFAYKLKFAPAPGTIGQPYESSCRNENTPADRVRSTVFISDGSDRSICVLRLYNDRDCRGGFQDYSLSRGGTNGVTDCINDVWRSARVRCGF